MDIWVMIGWIVVILMVIAALRLILKKPQATLDVQESEQAIEPQSQQPVIPRHLRQSQLPAEAVVEQQTVPVVQQDVQTASSQENQLGQTDLQSLQSLDAIAEAATNAPPTAESNHELDTIPEQQHNATSEQNEPIAKSEESLLDTPPVIPEKIAVDSIENHDWSQELNVLDAHLSEQSRQDEESALATAQQLVALYVYPNPSRALSGDRALKILLKYGLRFGEMSCFHRYHHPEQVSPLMFSLLRINEDGTPTGFDLEALPGEEVKGLAFFLALPSPHAVEGFDMMTSIAGLIARDIEGMVFDEQSLELTPQLREHWRHFVIEYKPQS